MKYAYNRRVNSTIYLSIISALCIWGFIASLRLEILLLFFFFCLVIARFWVKSHKLQLVIYYAQATMIGFFSGAALFEVYTDKNANDLWFYTAHFLFGSAIVYSLFIILLSPKRVEVVSSRIENHKDAIAITVMILATIYFVLQFFVL